MAGGSSLVRHLVRRPLAGWGWLAHRALTGTRLWVEVSVEPASVQARARTLERLARITADASVAGVVFTVRGSPGGWAAVGAWRRAIADLRAAGRWTEAYLPNPTDGTLVLASACDRITVPDGATIGLSGVGVVTTHQAAALARLGLEAEVVAAGAYKSAGEPWARSYASAPARDALRGLVDDLDAQAVAALSSDRGVPASAVLEARAVGWMSPPEARQRGLIDAIGDPSTVRVSVRERLGAHAVPVAFEAWAARTGAMDWVAGVEDPIRVGVVHVHGPIVEGSGGRGANIRARPTVEALEGLIGQVDAAVLHVDSPGGAVAPSQRIADAIATLGREMPVVACYADVSASGGVMISAAATRIMASPGSITGSIGVVGGKLVARDALRKVGVTTEAVGGGPSLAAFSPVRRFTEAERQRFGTELGRVYDGFVHRVAAGRGRPVSEVEPSCRGRVWTGRQALDRGLVDRLGDLSDAIAWAAALADGDPAQRPVVATHDDPNQRSPLDALRDMAGQGAVASWEVVVDAGVREAFGPLGPALLRTPGMPLAVWPWAALPTAR